MKNRGSSKTKVEEKEEGEKHATIKDKFANTNGFEV
jgi:hypothetical protein